MESFLLDWCRCLFKCFFENIVEACWYTWTFFFHICLPSNVTRVLCLRVRQAKQVFQASKGVYVIFWDIQMTLKRQIYLCMQKNVVYDTTCYKIALANKLSGKSGTTFSELVLLSVQTLLKIQDGNVVTYIETFSNVVCSPI